MKTPMARAHFQTIATAIAELEVDERTRAHIVRTFDTVLEQTNPRFDWVKFHEAAGVTVTKLG